MFAAGLLSFCVGFLSLSLEILWIRLFSFANHSLPQAFAFVLATYLLGIAFGARIGKHVCESALNLWLVSGVVLVISSVADVMLPWLYVQSVQTQATLWIGGSLILLTALLKAILFPIAHHLGAPSTSAHAGRGVSRVYVANIMGATLGPLFTGFVLLSLLTTQQCFIVCALLTFLLALYCLQTLIRPAILLAGTAPLLLLFVGLLSLNSHLLIAKASATLPDLRRVIENQYGIITIYKDAKYGDIIAGGNVYDGRTNLDPVLNSNGLNRVIVLSALHANPEKVLMIGLSIGSWLKIVTSFPGVKQIDVMEINPGYLQAMQDYPRQLSALDDTRVHVYWDDGRRWLKAHPEVKYDMIIMNTTYHWRAYTSALLSQEFLTLVRKHMNTNAVMTYNTTESLDAFKTATRVFKHAYLYGNFVIAADFDWRKKLNTPAAAKTLSALMLDGKPLFPKHSDKVIQAFLTQTLIPLAAIAPLYEVLGRQVEVITDRNLISEYKYGKKL